jgi:23S rRNA (cytosine1962-C5)-methyltransferase
LWVKRSDIEAVDAQPGDVVGLVGPRGRTLGYGLFSDRSPIAVRLMTRSGSPPDALLWRDRLADAIAYRATLSIDATAYRLVHGEGDLLPSLVVDRYSDVLVLQALSQGVDRHIQLIRDLLVELVHPVGILARHDEQIRALEGLPRRVELLYGEVPHDLAVRDGPVHLCVDPWEDHATGLFLDQRENRLLAAEYARGRALDCFCYTGGFALHLARRCEEVVAVDSSPTAVDRLTRHASLNGVTNLRSHVADVFEILPELGRAGITFDTVVLDPPPLARNRSAMSKALAGYKELNFRAFSLLAPGGTLVTCCRSTHVDDATFTELVSDAANDARARAVLLERRLQSRDHPVLVSVPETSHLKCLVMRRMG